MNGIDFADAVSVLYDHLAVTISGTESGESRYISMGMDGQGRLLVVAYTIRGNRVRLISARKAIQTERQQYKELT